MNFINKANSQDFLDILGPGNAPHGISKSMQRQIIASLVELRCREDDKRSPLPWIPVEVKKDWQECSLRAMNNYRRGEKFTRYTQLHADIHRQRECDSVNQLASQYGYDALFGIHPKNISCRKPLLRLRQRQMATARFIFPKPFRFPAVPTGCQGIFRFTPSLET